MPPPSDHPLVAENAELRARLEESEEILRAIRAGEVDAHLVEGDDITSVSYSAERRQAEAALSRSAELFSKIIEQAPGGVYVVDGQFRLQHVNAEALPVFASVQPLIGRDFDEVMEIVWGPEVGAHCASIFRHTLATGERHVTPSFSAVRHDLGVEQSFAWETQRITLPDGQHGVVCYFQEVTARERAEVALRASEARFRAAVGAVGSLIWTNNARGEMEAEQPGWGSFTGQTREEYNGYGWAKAVHPEDAQPTIDAWNQAVAEKRIFEFEHRVRRHDGEWRLFTVRAVPVLGEGGEIHEWVGVHTDVTERQQAETMLRQNAEMFTTLIEQAPMGMYVVDADFRVRQMNAEALPIFTSVQPLMGRDFKEALNILWGPEVGGQIADIFRHTLATGEPYFSPPFTKMRADLGMEQSYEWQTQRLTLPDGTMGVACYFHEVTERTQATEALRASQERIRLAAEATGVGIWEWNVATNEVHWDAVMFNIYGVTPTSDGLVQYSDWSGGVLPEDLAENEAILQDTVRRCGQSRRSFRIRRRTDGECRHVECVETVRLDAAGKAAIVVGTNLDVTDRKRAEQKLLESEARLGGILRRSPAGIVQTDATGCMTLVNPRWSEMVGYPEAELLGRNILDITHPSSLDETAAAFGRTAAGGPDFQIEKAYRRKDGSILRAQSNVAAIRSPEGEFLGIVAAVLDISERLRAEEELRWLAAELSEVDRRKNEFLATLAHELRNPLAPVRTAVEILRRKGPADAELQWTQDIIDRQLDTLTRLIDDLMDVSRINQGKVELQREQVELQKIVQGAVETSRPLIEEMGHELTVSLPPEPVIVDVDQTRMAQVLTNLLNNAAKYTERGGRIDLRAELQGSEVVLSVADTGIGIAAEKLPTIFEMFSQVEGALSRSQGGLGIGLCLVKQLVEMHGGGVEAKSVGPGMGSEFLVRLPIVLDAQTVRDEVSEDDGCEAQATSGLRILMVDDNLDIARVMTVILAMWGYRVHTAYDGEEAVTAAREFQPDVVLCDIGLPGLNGYEACRLMKAQAWHPKMVLIAISGWGQDEDRRKSEEAGFAHHLVKPVDPQSLKKLLSSLDTAKV